MATTCTCCGEVSGPTVKLLKHDVTICYNCLDWLERQRRIQIAGHSGRWHVVDHEPVFKVSNIERAKDHYTKLGFEISEHDETYAFAHRDGVVTIHLTFDDGVPSPSALYLHVDDANQVATEWRLAGMAVDGPVDEEYGKTEGSHRDPDGNLIRFGSPLR
jgi:catechol 2,3-dioxygenase-like lactoylglutathione lyase family enzyme